MAKKQTKKVSTKISKDNVFLVLNLVIAVVAMAFAAVLTSQVTAEVVDYKKVSLFFGIAIATQILFQILLFIVKDNPRDRFRALVVGGIYVAAMIMAFISYEHAILPYLATLLIVIAMAINQFLQISKDSATREIITCLLVGIMLTLLAVAIVLEIRNKDVNNIPLVAVLLFLFVSFRKILFPTLKLEKIKLLFNILVKTHTIDVLVCLLSIMIAFSFIIQRFEASITNFWDAMWYCFAVVTTIGFGDFYATTLIGRVLTVILGIYGIVVVAILTSVVVNYYNEVTQKEKSRDFIE